MKTRTLLIGLGSLLAASVAVAQMPDLTKIKFKTEPVVGTLSVIQGANGFAGGNVTVSVGADGVFLVDDALFGMGAKLKAQVAALSKKPIRFVLNTHWHGDHTGGNKDLAGGGALLVAQDNVRKRMSVEHVMSFGGHKMTVPASPPAALPVVTFAEDVTLHVNGDDVHAFHVAPAHTDGDVIVHFTKANVISSGDVFMNQAFPIVDIDNGGKYEGLLQAADKLLALANDTTKIIPGHGPVGGKADVAAWKALLILMRDKVTKAAAGGKTLEQVLAAKPLAEYDGKLTQTPVNSDIVTEMIYRSVIAAK